MQQILALEYRQSALYFAQIAIISSIVAKFWDKPRQNIASISELYYSSAGYLPGH